MCPDSEIFRKQKKTGGQPVCIHHTFALRSFLILFEYALFLFSQRVPDLLKDAVDIVDIPGILVSSRIHARLGSRGEIKVGGLPFLIPLFHHLYFLLADLIVIGPPVAEYQEKPALPVSVHRLFLGLRLSELPGCRLELIKHDPVLAVFFSERFRDSLQLFDITVAALSGAICVPVLFFGHIHVLIVGIGNTDQII